MLKNSKLFYFCHLKKLVRPENFRPYYVFHTNKNKKYVTDVVLIMIIMYKTRAGEALLLQRQDGDIPLWFRTSISVSALCLAISTF